MATSGPGPLSGPSATYDEMFGGTHPIAKAFSPKKGNFTDYRRNKTNIHEAQGLRPNLADEHEVVVLQSCSDKKTYKQKL